MKLKHFEKFEITNPIYIYGGIGGGPTEGEEEGTSSPQGPPPGIPSIPLEPKKELGA